MTPALPYYLTLSAILFAVGMMGVFTRRNVLIVFMSIELMLNSVNLAFVAISRHLNAVNGQAIVMFVMAVAAAEVAVGLAIIIAWFRNRESVDVDDLSLLKW
ncbi:MAG: NADH-quinone oxidoreductase subunit NuoK [Armatimonadetes bacterium]|nr:NADH-quinone oxidoreductase subunit NuoK [Armatimonadota bacterium]